MGQAVAEVERFHVSSLSPAIRVPFTQVFRKGPAYARAATTIRPVAVEGATSSTMSMVRPEVARAHSIYSTLGSTVKTDFTEHL